MKKTAIYICVIISFALVTQSLPAQNAQDSQQDQVKKLPQIQLEDYTIVGLEKVVLPRKERRSISRQLSVNWEENELVRLKQTPTLSFRSREKPGLGFLNNYPDVDALVQYGSFNTLGANLKARFDANSVSPFVEADFRKSNGHVDQADYTKAAISSGLEGQAWANSVFQLTGRYRNDEQNLWSSIIPPDSSRKTTLELWQFQGNLNQKLSAHFTLNSGGQFQTLDFENRFNYTQDFISAGLGLNLTVDQTSVTAEGWIDHINTESESDSNASRLWNGEYSFYSSILDVVQRINDFSIGAGIRVQHLETARGTSGAASKTYAYPRAEIAFNAKNIFHLFARYQPGFESQCMEQMLKAQPLADFSSFQPLKIKHKVSGGLSLRSASGLVLKVNSTYEESENYPILYSSFQDTTIKIVPFQSLSYQYPYWEYRYINNARILENSLRMQLNFSNRFLIDGWATYRWNEIKTVDERGNMVSGNEIPYLPQLEGTLRLQWYFFQHHRLELKGEYVGERFDDVANSIKLKDHVLVSALVNFEIARQVNLRFFGNNLLDQDYQVYHTYSAPGISGGAGIEIKL